MGAMVAAPPSLARSESSGSAGGSALTPYPLWSPGPAWAWAAGHARSTPAERDLTSAARQGLYGISGNSKTSLARLQRPNPVELLNCRLRE